MHKITQPYLFHKVQHGVVVVRASPRLVVSAVGEPREALILCAAGVVQVRHHLGRDELIGRTGEEEDRHADAAHLPPRLVLVLVEPRRYHSHQAKAGAQFSR